MSEALNQDELSTLADLLTNSQKAKGRQALCIRIGIDPHQLGFMYESSDSSFAINLINYLNQIGDTEAICKLCCKELSPIFKENHKSFLKGIEVKLNCNYYFKQNSPNNKQQTVPSSSSALNVSVNLFNQLVKNILITGSTILLIGLAGFSLFNQNKNNNSPLTQATPSIQITPSTPEPGYPITPSIKAQQPKAYTPPESQSSYPIILLYGYKTDPRLFNQIQNSVGFPIEDNRNYQDQRPSWLAIKPTVLYFDKDLEYFASDMAKKLTNSTGEQFETQYVYPENRVGIPHPQRTISIHI